MAGGGDLEVIAGQEVHGDAADFLAGIVGHWYDFAVLAFLGFDFFNRGQIFRPIRKSGELIGELTDSAGARFQSTRTVIPGCQ
ncbi:hypothetical protein D3C85_943580 [compost metagenome]